MKLLWRCALTILAVASPVAAWGADIQVLTAGAYKPVITILQADFERQTGHRLIVQNDTAGALQRRIGCGEAFDVVVATPAVLEHLAAAGKVSGNPIRLARVAIHQISEILAVPGATLVGPIPAEIQNYTLYAGSVSASAANPGAARALLDALAGAGARAVLQSRGMEAP